MKIIKLKSLFGYRAGRSHLEKWEQVAKDKNTTLDEVVSFNDYVLPNEALNNKDVDANASRPAV